MSDFLLCNPVDYTVHGILQASILEWVAFPFSRGSSQPRNRTQVSCIAGRFFTSWVTREAQEYWSSSLVAQMVKCLPAMRDARVGSLGWEDPLEKEMATHSSTLAWRIPWMQEPGGLQAMGLQRVGHHWATSLVVLVFYLVKCHNHLFWTFASISILYTCFLIFLCLSFITWYYK